MLIYRKIDVRRNALKQNIRNGIVAGVVVVVAFIIIIAMHKLAHATIIFYFTLNEQMFIKEGHVFFDLIALKLLIR